MRIHTTSFLTIIYGVGVFSANASILSVSFNVPGHAASIDQLVVKAIVTNTGPETLKLVNDPRTVLSTAQTKTFIITKSDNVPEFTGMIAK
jgi:peptidyl-Lys metalloendopeptidase